MYRLLLFLVILLAFSTSGLAEKSKPSKQCSYLITLIDLSCPRCAAMHPYILNDYRQSVDTLRIAPVGPFHNDVPSAALAVYWSWVEVFGHNPALASAFYSGYRNNAKMSTVDAVIQWIKSQPVSYNKNETDMQKVQEKANGNTYLKRLAKAAQFVPSATTPLPIFICINDEATVTGIAHWQGDEEATHKQVLEILR